MTKLFTILMLVLVTGCGIPFMNKEEEQTEPEKTYPIRVYGKQFEWIFQYPGPDGLLGNISYKLVSDSNVIGMDMSDTNSHDDFILRDDMHIPKDYTIELRINSRDVIHCVYMPQFRASMNAVPGMTTKFTFKATNTTKEMRTNHTRENFDYMLMCNKICGKGHLQMKRKIIVETVNEFDAWCKINDRLKK